MNMKQKLTELAARSNDLVELGCKGEEKCEKGKFVKGKKGKFAKKEFGIFTKQKPEYGADGKFQGMQSGVNPLGVAAGVAGVGAVGGGAYMGHNAIVKNFRPMGPLQEGVSATGEAYKAAGVAAKGQWNRGMNSVVRNVTNAATHAPMAAVSAAVAPAAPIINAASKAGGAAKKGGLWAAKKLAKLRFAV